MNLPIISKPGAITQLFIALGLFVSGMFGSLQQQAEPVLLFSDLFDRADSGTVGNGWTEVETSTALVGIQSNRLCFLDTSDASNRPLVRHSFPPVGGTQVKWEFDFDWTRTGSEGVYLLYMQLGQAALMSDSAPSNGIGVNLVWTNLNAVNETLAYRRDGVSTSLGVLSGAHRIAVIADNASQTYSVSVDGNLLQSGIPYEDPAMLDTVRFLTNGLNEVNFSGRCFDNLVIQDENPSPVNTSTPTPTATSTFIPGPSPTFTNTPLVTATFTPTATQTSTSTPTFTPTMGPAGDGIFSDGFEAGSFTAWSAFSDDGGDLSVSPASALAGGLGMQAVIDDNRAIYLRDDTPSAEPRYRVRFYFDPNSIVMANSDAHLLLIGNLGSSTDILRLVLRFYNGAYQVIASLNNDSASWKNTGYKTISNAPHFLELDWRAASQAGANDGSLTLWIDGVQQANVTGVDNDTHRLDQVRFGAVTGIDNGTRGTYYFDAFTSRRQTYIGPEGGGPATTPTPTPTVTLTPTQTLTPTATPICSAQVKIMPLGDSITKGTGTCSEPNTTLNCTGYRDDLWNSLVGNLYSVDFVGSEGGEFQYLYTHDNNHEGHGGYPANRIRDNVYTSGEKWLVNYPADLILLHIGTNDISTGQPSSEIVTEVGQILDQIDQYEAASNKVVPVILARIINRRNPNTTAGQATTTFNNQLQTMADARIAAGDRIIVVNMEPALSYPADFYDSLHPNSTGYSKLATVWYNALAGVLNQCPGGANLVANP